jgi:hypothetical protein
MLLMVNKIKLLILTVFVAAISVTPTVIFAETETVTLTATVNVALALTISSANYSFGSLIPGSPVKGSGGIDVFVETSAPNGYTLAIHDSVGGTDSALLHSDATTRIADFTSTIASPSVWSSGTSKGLGLTVYSADTSKEAKWGTGTTYNDANNAYVAVPQTASIIHSSAGYKAGIDTTSIAFILDVPPSQKTGNYSGTTIITATAVLE